jgi:hypothetical protein
LIGGNELVAVHEEADDAVEASDVDIPAINNRTVVNATPIVANFRPLTTSRAILMNLVVFVMSEFLIREG